MDDLMTAGSYGAWGDLNRRFHLGISALTQLPMLQEMTARIFDRWDRVRRYYFTHVLVHRARQAQGEHRQILDAMRAKDLDRLQTLVRQHNQSALVAYMSYLSGQTSQAGGIRLATPPSRG
jgi:DNA-binding GntR family transcriptional regulator